MISLAARGLVKRYGGSAALDGVDFDLRAGEVHALLGENGAGKSTLVRILAGLTTPDAGEILVGGEPSGNLQSAYCHLKSTSLRLGVVHQHFMLVPNFTVAENLALAAGGPAAMHPRRAAGPALALARSLGWVLDPNAMVRGLPVGAQQRLEILKALHGAGAAPGSPHPRILILDEPTATLAPAEVDDLFRLLRRLRAEGHAVLFISHKLAEVLALSDRVTVLRRGRVVASLSTADAHADALAGLMVGDEAPAAAATVDREEPTPATGAMSGAGCEARPCADRTLHLKNLEATDDRGRPALRGIALDVGAGEIVGIAGADGNGQTELAETLAGRRPYSGRIRVAGRAGYIPGDRHRHGLILEMTLAENVALEAHRDAECRRGPLLSWRRIRAEAEALLAEMDVRGGRPDLPARALSGGNQQKLVIGRALRRRPSVLVIVNPTRGLDVAATAEVHRRLRAARDAGAAVLLISTDLDEVLALSDRVGVLYGGRLSTLLPPDTPREHLGLLMGGA